MGFSKGIFQVQLLEQSLQSRPWMWLRLDLHRKFIGFSEVLRFVASSVQWQSRAEHFPWMDPWQCLVWALQQHPELCKFGVNEAAHLWVLSVQCQMPRLGADVSLLCERDPRH